MVDVDTFLTILYVMVEDFCQTRAPKKRPAPEASLWQSEVITLAMFARWSRFNSERDFYRYADGLICEEHSLHCQAAPSSTVSSCASIGRASRRSP
jgi:hypothetical protein